MDAIPWFGWVAIVGVIMVFTYAIIDIVTKRRYTGQKTESMQNVADEVRASNREVLNRLDAMDRRLDALERRPGSGP